MIDYFTDNNRVCSNFVIIDNYNNGKTQERHQSHTKTNLGNHIYYYKCVYLNSTCNGTYAK